jgi:hypothetical protein
MGQQYQIPVHFSIYLIRTKIAAQANAQETGWHGDTFFSKNVA